MELDVATNDSLSMDEKQKALVVINKCLPRFPDDLWVMVQQKMMQGFMASQQDVAMTSTRQENEIILTTTVPPTEGMPMGGQK